MFARAVDGRLEFVDAHMHLWHVDTGWYALGSDGSEPVSPLGATGRVMGQDFVLSDYLELVRRYDVRGIVHVAAAATPPSPVHETAAVQATLDQADLPGVVIAEVDFDGPLAQVTAALDQQERYPRFRGIRHRISPDTADPRIVRCFRLMADRGLLYDAMARDDTLPLFEHLASAVPELSLVIEHAGWPRQTDGDTFRRWHAGMAALAAHPQVAVKISGLGMTIHNWTTDDLRPWVEATLELFGPDRTMLASNFPIDLLYSSADRLFDAYEELTESLSVADRRLVYAETALRVYRP